MINDKWKLMTGVLIIDKPAGITSHDVIYRVRRILRTKAVGHTGTLDPFATGILVVLVGNATRLAQFLDKAEKEYSATIRFGFETDTGDCTGTAKSEISNLEFQISNDQIENALAKFRGEIWQTPPMYSAKKVDGKKLYELARKGEMIERQPVKINISKLEIATDQRPKTKDQITIQVAVSAGTYIRVLAEDIGRELKIGAHLSELRRTRAGNFDLSQAVTLEKLAELAEADNLDQVLITPNNALAHLPQIILDANRVSKTLNGLETFIPQQFDDAQLVRMCDEQQNLIAVGTFDKNSKSVKPRVVLGVEK